MPAAAVIPAPKAYIKAVAVKKLVVGSWTFWAGGLPHRRTSATLRSTLLGRILVLFVGCRDLPASLTLKKSECSKQATEPECHFME